ncbi:molybdopterin molybdenumtransferase MoeA [Pontibacillus yanchengensis]|uniref:Molybdopterin molybdenumtransferase MoeA n=2 Tax=Pontibacillus yanchengensis TaxID=462910 RepID=A0ACC7VBV5_9BACI|nr:gephyrin-like molybdotransferase Glp [Pontibacillus yanchengensis]MYL34772.1 molybdopterin molybdenumtransferase MoeA [Pontibacillus yanchengensis]MYL52242.1 molybdopterin molybdenumtransferase MoeA [Pontibacillus yanchengensis]
MIEKRTPIKVTEAVNRVMAYAREHTYEIVSIEESDGRVLAEDIFANQPIPPFDKSPYDGFAFKAADTNQASQDYAVSFEVVEHIPAGTMSSRTLQHGEAARIMTGAPLPRGADCVAMFEVCQSYEDNEKELMSIKRTIQAGDNVNHKGSETLEGTHLIEKGTYIHPGVKAVLATFGYATVHVSKKPVIGLFTTGTELLDVKDDLVPGKIRNSNGHMIASQIKRAGGEVKMLGTLADDFETSYNAIQETLHEVDMVITTGGVSVGDYDLMPDIYDKLEAEQLFNKVAMRPGSVTTVAVKGDQLLFGLSGNPSACYVGFELFVRPVIQKAMFSKQPYPPKSKAYLTTDFPKPNPFTRFVRSRVFFKDGQLWIEPAGPDKSAVVTSLIETNAFMMLPGGTRGFKKGDRVEVIFLETVYGQKEPWTT